MATIMGCILDLFMELKGETLKKTFIVCIATIMFVSCAQSGFNEEEIVIDKNSTVIDVRTEKEYRQGHLRNAILIPYGEIKDKITDHVQDKNEKIILYCRSARRSGIAKKTLDEMGYKNVINAGAYVKLKKRESQKQKE